MESLILELIPHDPTIGLFVAPDIPFKKLHNAIEDYAKNTRRDDVVALYDATLMGSAKDGALFLSDRFIFQNNNLEPAHDISYNDLVKVELKKKLIGGQRLLLSINRGRATIELEMDFAARSKAAPFVMRFLDEALLKTAAAEMDADPRMKKQRSPLRVESSETDQRVVEETLIALVREGSLSEKHYREMMRILR